MCPDKLPELIEFGIMFKSGAFRRHIITTMDGVTVHRFRHKNTGVFTTVYAYAEADETGNLQRESLKYGPFYLDFDKKLDDETSAEANFQDIREDVLAALRYVEVIFNLPRGAASLFFSGSKGVHLIIRPELIGAEPHTRLHEIYKMMAEDIKKATKHDTIDLKVYGPVQMWRVPNSRHQKTNLYKIPITLEEFQTLSLVEIKKLAEGPRVLKAEPITLDGRSHKVYREYELKHQARNKPRSPVTHSTSLKLIPPCIKKVLDEKTPEGRRDNTATALASYFRQCGMKDEEALDRLGKWNDTNVEPPLHQHDLDRIINSIYNRDYKLGCTWMKSLGIECDQNCPMHKPSSLGRNLPAGAVLKK